jgi:hypothetical protein
MLDEPHGAALESERGKLGIVEFEKNVDERIAQAAEVEVFHEVDDTG